jgi:hypothetical protein
MCYSLDMKRLQKSPYDKVLISSFAQLGVDEIFVRWGHLHLSLYLPLFHFQPLSEWVALPHTTTMIRYHRPKTMGWTNHGRNL